MFNQKVNAYWSQNPDYLNYSLGAPAIRATDIHNCGTTIDKYKKAEDCGALPLQTWCSPNVAVESFAMRPIVNSKEYFENIKKYLGGLIYTDSIELKNSKLASESYTLISDYGVEPQSSFLQAIKLDITNKLMFVMGESNDKISMFKDFNPLCEGLILMDIDIVSYQSVSNQNHFFHKIVFSTVNTTRYNTISYKAEIFQDTTPMMGQWNSEIQKVQDSKDVSKDITTSSIMYISNIDLLNNTMCVLGQESDCQFKGYNTEKSSWSQLLNDNLLAPTTKVDWVEPNSIIGNTYTNQGNYDSSGNIRIVDSGPSNIDDILKSLKFT